MDNATLITHDDIKLTDVKSTVYVVGYTTGFEVRKITVEMALGFKNNPHLVACLCLQEIFFHRSNADKWAINNKPITLSELEAAWRNNKPTFAGEVQDDMLRTLYLEILTIRNQGIKK